MGGRRTKPGTRPATREKRRRFDEAFKQEAVQMLVDGHSAPDVAARLGLSGPTLLYRSKKELLGRSRRVAASLEERVRELEAVLERAEESFRDNGVHIPRGRVSSRT